MRDESPTRALAWMATGAAVLAVGAFLGSASARRKESSPPEPRDHAGDDRDRLDDLADRPVAHSAPAEGLAAARRVESLAEAVTNLETRVHAVERASAADRVEEVWNRLQQLEERVEEIQSQRLETTAVEAVAASVADRISPRFETLQARVELHQKAIEQLQVHAAQTEANLQKMIVAVEKLTEQISRSLPSLRTPEPASSEQAAGVPQ